MLNEQKLSDDFKNQLHHLIANSILEEKIEIRTKDYLEDIQKNKVMALSWKQPYGTAMLHGKDETRTWNTNYRGLVLICTSKQCYNEEAVVKISGRKLFVNLCVKMNPDKTETLDMDGFAIAIGRLVDSRPMKLCDEGKCFVKFNPDLYVHVYSDVRPIKPFAWKGSQGFRTLTQEEKDKIEFV